MIARRFGDGYSWRASLSDSRVVLSSSCPNTTGFSLDVRSGTRTVSALAVAIVFGDNNVAAEKATALQEAKKREICAEGLLPAEQMVSSPIATNHRYAPHIEIGSDHAGCLTPEAALEVCLRNCAAFCLASRAMSGDQILGNADHPLSPPQSISALSDIIFYVPCSRPAINEYSKDPANRANVSKRDGIAMQDGPIGRRQTALVLCLWF